LKIDEIGKVFGGFATRRKYVSFFEWIDREGKELGVAEELLDDAERTQ